MFIFLIFFIISLVNSWRLTETMSGNTFFNNFYFYDGADPTHGYVKYVNRDTAFRKGYTKVNNDKSVYIGCDFNNIASGSGRESVRIHSYKRYSYGLFILSLKHMPYGCGTWPAFWMVGPSWPNGGEIDIIEGVDNQQTNHLALHTSNNCNYNNRPTDFHGRWGTGWNGQPASNCYIHAHGQYGNQGCGIKSYDETSYGERLNNVGGGVYATQWTSDGIYIWYWNKNNIPADVTSENPNPWTWGKPMAAWQFGSWCTADHFKDLRIIINLTFCGDWGNAVFGRHCPNKGSCSNYVKNNPNAFKDAFWDIEYLKVYQ